MKQFIAKMQEERTPHERRRWALSMAGILTATLFVVWLATLGARVAYQNQKTAEKNNTANSQTAAVANSSAQTKNTLEVTPTSVYR